MMSSPADVAYQFLLDRGLAEAPPATLSGWPVVVDFMPDPPQKGGDNYIGIFNTGSYLQFREHYTGTYAEFPSVQVQVRGKTDEVAVAKGYAVQDLFRMVGFPPARGGFGWVDVTPPGSDNPVSLRAAHLKAPLTPLRQEEVNRRKVYVMNFQLTIWEG